MNFLVSQRHPAGI